MINKLHFTQLKPNLAIFVNILRIETVLALEYIDNLVNQSVSSVLLDEKIGNFLAHFDGKYEPLERYHGPYIQIFENNCLISQESYIKQALRDFGYKDINIYATSMVLNFSDELSHHSHDKAIDELEYRAMTGVLLFISRRARPDISTAVGILSHLCNKPTKVLSHSVKVCSG